MKTRSRVFTALLGLLLAVPAFVGLGAISGCGGGLYAIQANSATSKLEEARAVGAAQWAPYEYYYAKEHLRQAQVEASEASYSDAINYAETAEEFAQKAIQLSQAARGADGRQ